MCGSHIHITTLCPDTIRIIFTTRESPGKINLIMGVDMLYQCCMVGTVESINERSTDMTRQELLNELTKVQNMPQNLDKDIMTIAAMMDNEQIAAHIERNR